MWLGIHRSYKSFQSFLWRWWWIISVAGLTDEEYVALFPVWTIARDLHHHESPTHLRLITCRTWTCDHNQKFVTLFEFWNLTFFTKKSTYMGYIISFWLKLRFHRTQGNTQLRPSLVKYRSIFKGYMLILDHHLWVTLIFHMNESIKNKTGSTCCMNNLVPWKRAKVLGNKGVI